ncbi:MAG: helix-turn-helix domain-containing protein [Candidatus Hydrogenedentales bacterium]
MNRKGFSGQELRARREKRGLNYDEVYRELRVPAYCIRAFESGDLDSLPALIYSQGFLKSYCEFLGVNPEPYVEALRATEEVPASSRFLGLGRKVVSTGAGGSWVGDALAWAAISIILALGWATYTIVVQPGADPQQTQVQADILEVTPPALPE